MITAKTPWKDHLGDVPMHLDYFEGSMSEALERIVQQYPPLPHSYLWHTACRTAALYRTA